MLESLENIKIIVAISGLVLLTLVESVHPFFDFFKGSIKKRGAHYLRNLVIGFINAIIIGVLFIGAWYWATSFASKHSLGILNVVEYYIPVFTGGWRLLVAILLFDLWMYAWHRINHAVPFLWRFHKVHHSDPHMDVSTATRFHAGEIIISSALRIGVLIIVGMTLWELFIYEIVALLVIQFHHANINLPKRIDRFLKLFIVTPSMHKVHHSSWQPETDSNFSTIFSFWDRLFSTFNQNKEPEKIILGLEEHGVEEEQHLSKILKMPFDK